MKMNSQFGAGNSGGARIHDTVGAGSDLYDEKLRVVVPKEVRAMARNSVIDLLVKPGTMKAALGITAPAPPSLSSEDSGLSAEDKLTALRKEEDDAREEAKQAGRRIFEGLVVYVNGSTHPLISDHKLKHLLAEHGARMSLHLGRRQVTHVILGRPNGGGFGAGGGLAGGKLEREIRRVGGCGIKFVGVEWYGFFHFFPYLPYTRELRYKRALAPEFTYTQGCPSLTLSAGV
jgi:hypothetical protein